MSPLGISARLQDQGLSKRMITVNKEIVAATQPAQVWEGGHQRGFPSNATVAGLAGEHEIPHAVHVELVSVLPESVRKEMIDLGWRSSVIVHGNVLRAVETLPLLVAVQSIATRGHVNTA